MSTRQGAISYFRDLAKQTRESERAFQEYAANDRERAERLEAFAQDLASEVAQEVCDGDRAKLKEATTPRLLSEWSEEIGPVLWWRFPIDEPPYVGSPLDIGFTVEIHAVNGVAARGNVGGWPGYHTHWTPILMPVEPANEIRLNDSDDATPSNTARD